MMKRTLLAIVVLSALVFAGIAYAFTVTGDPPADVNFENQVCQAINDLRIKNGLQPYQIDPRLQLAAENKARDMAQWQYMDHNRPATPDGQPAEDWTQHFFDAGYPNNAAFGENLAYNFPDAQSLVAAWSSDSGHLGNMLSPLYVGVGCGVAWSAPTANTPAMPFEAMDAGAAPLPQAPPPPTQLLTFSSDANGITAVVEQVTPKTRYALSCVVGGWNVGGSTNRSNANGKVKVFLPLPLFLSGDSFNCWVRQGNLFDDPAITLADGTTATFSGP